MVGPGEYMGKKRPSVMIVDGDPIYRLRIGQSFRALHWETVDGSGSEEALTIARHSPAPLLAVVSLSLPVSSGFAVIDGVREVAPNIVAVVVCDDLTAATCKEAFRRGAVSAIQRAEAGSAAEILASLGPLESLDLVAYRHLHRVLVLCHGNRTVAARHAGTSRRGLDYKLEKLRNTLR